MPESLIGVLFNQQVTILLIIGPKDPPIMVPSVVPNGPKIEPSAAIRTCIPALDKTGKTESRNPLKNCEKGLKAAVSEVVGLYEVSTGMVVAAHAAIFVAVCWAEIVSPVET